MRNALFLIAAMLPSIAYAQNSVTVKSEIFVVRTVTDAAGKSKRTLVDPVQVLPGERLAVILSYTNPAPKPATSFVINNPVNKSIAFTGTDEAWAVVSVDGGKTFGPLATLKVTGADGKPRPAIPADVDSIRWKFAQPIAAGASGKVAFLGVVK